MIALLTAVSLPYLRAHKLRIFLTLLGVVIGVQGMVAMSALSASIVRSFQAGIEAIAGNAVLQIAGPETGIPDALTAEALAVPGVESASPIIQGSFRTLGNPSELITVFGIDLLGQIGTRNPQFPREHVHIEDELLFLNAPDSIALGQPLLDSLGIGVGATIQLATPEGVRTFTVRGSMDAVGPMKLFDGAVGLLDLSTAQGLLLAPGLVQLIHIAVQPSDSIDAVASRLRAVIGSRARVERTSVRGEQVDAILGSLRVALALASLVTMIAAFFIIYQTVAISVEQRRRDIAIARALGFTRRGITAVFLVESLALGLVGVAGGTVGGYLLAGLSLNAAIAGLSGMYIRLMPGQVVLPLTATIGAGTLGMLTSLAAGLVPSWQAAREPPASVLRSTGGVEAERTASTLLLLAIGTTVVACLVLSVDPWLPTSGLRTAWIMAGHGLLIAGAALLAPSLVRLFARAMVPLASRVVLPAGLAIDFFSRRPRRVAAIASAVMVSYALVVVLGSAVRSIQRTTGDWLAHWFASNLAVATAPGLTTGTFDGAFASKLGLVPGVDAVERYILTLFNYRDEPVVLTAFDRRNRPDKNPLRLIRNLPDAYDLAETGDAVFVSESFAFRHGNRLGDTLELQTASGRRSFRIAAIVRDYATELGTILVDIEVYQRLWRDDRLKAANIWLSRNADPTRVKALIAGIVASDPRVSVVTNDEFRAEVEERGRNIVQVLNSLQFFACTIAIFGVINFLSAAILDRRREIGLLRSIGVTRRQVRLAVVIEAGLIGLVGAVLGALEGLPAGYYMVKHSLLVAMSWTLDFSFPTFLAISTAVTITLAAAAAGYIPARRITAEPITGGLQTE